MAAQARNVTSNQTFTVSSDETQVPLGADVEFTAEVGDAEEVTIYLLDADDVDVDNGTVSFETDDDGDFAAGEADGGTQITEVNGVAVPAAQFRNVTTIEDGEITFSVTAANNDAFVAFVAETEDFEADDVPDVDADGVPEDGFGVSATINVQDVVGIALLDADRTETTVFGVPATSERVEGETVNVSAVLFDNADPLDDDARVTAVGGELTYVVADNGEGADEYDAGDEPGSVANADVVASGTVAVVDGVANFSFTGGDDEDNYIILAEWEGVEDGAYDDLSETTFGPAGDLAEHGQITFTDDPAAAFNASFVDEDPQFAEVDGTATVAVSVTDQFGNPVSGVTVSFEADPDNDDARTFERNTNASGVATLAYSSDASDVDTITATVLGGDNPDNADPAVDGPDVTEGVVDTTPTVTWYTAAPDDLAEVAASDVVFLSGNWVVVELDDDTFARVNVEAGNQYALAGFEALTGDNENDFVDDAVSLATFLEALEFEDDADFNRAAANTTIEVAEAGALFTYTLTAAPE